MRSKLFLVTIRQKSRRAKMEKQRYRAWWFLCEIGITVNFWRVISGDRNENVEPSPWQRICVWAGGQRGLFSKRDASACSFRPRVGVHGWGRGGFYVWSFRPGIETSSLWLCYGLKDWKIKHDITWNRISWYCAAWANRILWHFVALPVGLNQFYLQKRTQIVDFTGFPWVASRFLVKWWTFNVLKYTETFIKCRCLTEIWARRSHWAISFHCFFSPLHWCWSYKHVI